jgi:hypothetical protein
MSCLGKVLDNKSYIGIDKPMFLVMNKFLFSRLFGKCWINIFLVFILSISWQFVNAQDESGSQRPDAAVFRSPPGNNTWFGTYGKVRITDKFFWDAQTHFRTAGYAGTPFVGRWAQIYNRHGIQYLVTPNFNMVLGGVLRLNFSPSEINGENFRNLRFEPRIWHEYIFSIPYPRFQVYHRLRFEHRWSIGNSVDAEWIYRDRWRYKFFMNIPINNQKLIPGTWYFTPDVEIIMQSGSPVIDSPLEDLRINPTIGYIASPRVKYTASMMYTTGQTLSDGAFYNTRWIARLNIYFSIDARKFVERLPEVKMLD